MDRFASKESYLAKKVNSSMVKRLKNYLPYMLKFGVYRGFVVARKLFPKTHKDEIVSFEIPQCEHSVQVRLGTSDVSSFHENFMLREFVLPPDLKPVYIVDVGANAGYASLVFLNRYKGASVLAIEPESSNIEMIRRNCDNYSGFKYLQSALWLHDGHVRILNPEASNSAFRIEETDSSDKQGFQSICMETILSKSPNGVIDILKLDIEGAEKELFESENLQWLEHVKVIIIELHDRFKPGCALAFHSAVEKYKLQQFSNGENLVYLNKDCAI